MRNKKIIVLFSIVCVITLAVILNSVVFRVTTVEVFCFNSADTKFASDIADATAIKGKSIFTLNERAVVDHIQSQMTSARVVNIERKFPNKALINVVRMLPYGYIDRTDSYIIVDNEMRVLEIVTTQPDLIKINIDADTLPPSQVLTPTPGQPLITDKGICERVLASVFSSLARLDYRQFDCIELIRHIDVSSSRELVLLKTKSGAVMEISGTGKMLQKIQYAVSLYVAKDANKAEGVTIRVFEDANGNLIPTVEGAAEA